MGCGRSKKKYLERRRKQIKEGWEKTRFNDNLDECMQPLEAPLPADPCDLVVPRGERGSVTIKCRDLPPLVFDGIPQGGYRYMIDHQGNVILTPASGEEEMAVNYEDRSLSVEELRKGIIQRYLGRDSI